MKSLLSARSASLAVLLGLTGLTSGCGGSSGGGSESGSVSSGVTLDVSGIPAIQWLSTTGRTQVILEFSAEDLNGTPLTENQVDVELLIDGNPVDVESVLNQDSLELEVNIYFAMVLDSSFSMTQHNPPAFEPMKTAARNSFQSVLSEWATRSGEVRFSLIWFDEIMNQSMFNVGTARDWVPNDITSIPEPLAGTATKLYSAVEVMANHLQSEYNSGIFNGGRDQYVMLVFTDGADNFSFWNNSNINSLQSTSSGALYRQFGTVPTTLQSAATAIDAHPKLVPYTIGFSAQANSDELTAIAEAQSEGELQGEYFPELTTGNIDDVFERVLREFTTVQTHGAQIPLPPADYDFTLSVTNRGGGNPATYEFRMHAGDPQARFISTL